VHKTKCQCWQWNHLALHVNKYFKLKTADRNVQHGAQLSTCSLHFGYSTELSQCGIDKKII
jgi:hypothetical protein